jgi:hypothetical protein
MSPQGLQCPRCPHSPQRKMEWRAISAISGVVVIAATFVNWTYRQIVKVFRKDFDELKEQIQVTIKTSKEAKKLAKRALYEARRAADQSKLWEARNEGRKDYGQSQITYGPRDKISSNPPDTSRRKTN